MDFIFNREQQQTETITQEDTIEKTVVNEKIKLTQKQKLKLKAENLKRKKEAEAERKRLEEIARKEKELKETKEIEQQLKEIEIKENQILGKMLRQCYAENFSHDSLRLLKEKSKILIEEGVS